MFETIVAIIAAGGLIGVALLMFAENVVPPVPSEVIMPLAGFAAAQGDLNFIGVVAAGTAGALAGAWMWYRVGCRVKEERLHAFVERWGRWLTLDHEDLERSKRFFHQRGGWAVFLGRLLPGVRTFISVPAGLMRMPAAPFLLWSLAGTFLWTLFLAGAGYVLASQYQRVERWLDPVTWVVMAFVFAAYVWRVVRFRRRTASRSGD